MEAFTFSEKQKFQDGVQDFFRFSNYTNTRKVNSIKKIEDVYIPEYDFIGPYFYYPMACYSRTSFNLSYPLIGYVKNNNAVERALIEEYKIVFGSQQQA